MKDKQETLEEAAYYYSKSLPKAIGNLENIVEMYKRYSFIEGAKWQEQNSDKIWSNDDVYEILSDWFLYRIDEDVEFKLTFSKWFEQFKKK